MEKHKISLVAIIALLFLTLMLGIYLGRKSYGSGILISIEARGEPTVVTTAPPDPTEESTEVVFPININTATSTELIALPGIGEVLAGKILEYRAQYGDFATLEELMDVPGISQKRFENIVDYITLGG